MSATPEGRLLFDPPASGPRNMAVDEVLLESAIAGGPPTLRFYQWTPATLSLGYFQPLAERDHHAPSRDVPLVRRASGGGAILHDHELTYSLALPTAHPLSRSPDRVYDLAHDVLVGWLAQRAIRAERYWPAGPTETPEPFLCFQRRARGDVLIDGAKVAGSAQRRRAGAVLQHGSILLRTSTATPELPGIWELTALDIVADELAEQLAPRFAAALGLHASASALTAEEALRTESLIAEKFAHHSWNAKR